MNGDIGFGPGVSMDPTIVSWMKSHTINDVLNIAQQLERDGSDVTEIRSFIDDLRSMTF